MIALAALAASASLLLPAWSPDGTRIAWSQAQTAWIADANGGNAKQLGSFDGLFQLDFVDEDTLLASVNYRLVTVRADGTKALLATGGPAFALDRARTHVAWQAADACPLCHGPILVRALAGGKTVKLGGHAQNIDPSLSPDGTRVVFIRNFETHGRWERPGGLWVGSTAGGPLRQLVRTGGCPAWSPNGARIAYWTRAALRVVPARGGRSVTVSRLNGSCPQWSPDGTRLAVIGPGAKLFVVDVGAQTTRAVTGASQGQVSGFAWSPDSSSLLLTGRLRPTQCYRLSVVAADGSARRTLRGC